MSDCELILVQSHLPNGSLLLNGLDCKSCKSNPHQLIPSNRGTELILPLAPA